MNNSMIEPSIKKKAQKTDQLELLNREVSNIHNELCGLDWLRRKTWPSNKSPKREPISIVSLFCGCGGMTLGVWEAARINNRSLDIRLSVDISSEALKVYKTNFKLNEANAINGDVCNLLPGEFGELTTQAERKLKKQVGNIDLIIAGPPCQGHSDLNNHSRRNDPRNNLFLKVIRAAELFEPKVILIENVPTIIHDKNNIIRNAFTYLESIRYSVASTILNGLNIGIPQRRKRFFLTATKKKLSQLLDSFDNNAQQSLNIKDFIGDLLDEPSVEKGIFYKPSNMTHINKERVNYLFKNNLYDLPNEFRPSCHKDKAHSYVSMYGRLKWSEPAQTITSGFGSMGQGRYVHPSRKRTITPHEAARIQGFPDFYSFSTAQKRTALQEMIGNAVPPRFSAIIMQEMIIQKIL